MTAAAAVAAVALALPWLLGPLAVLWRARDSRSLEDEPADPPPTAPLVSVIVPARNEARNIARCVRSLLATTYPAVEAIVVDDQSADGTGGLARAAAAGDPRLRVFEAPPLPPGWFGKPWACATGAREARGELLCFTDADTEHGPELLARSVSAMRARGVDAISVAGRQELGSFWERVIQPQMFFMLLARYGGSETVRRSRRAEDKIANGQFILVRRDGYEAIGGHASVRGEVAEDLMLAQLLFAAGRDLVLIGGTRHLATRMYTSLGELLEGWRKNVFAGGRNAMPFGRVGRIIYPLVLVLAPVLMLLPPLGLIAGLAGLAGPGVLLWGTAATSFSLAAWTAMYRRMDESPVYALLYPVGAAMLLYIFLGSIARGSRVAWKGRQYTVE